MGDEDAPENRTLRVDVSSEMETMSLAAYLASVTPPPATIGLSGDLGAGKTAFVRGFVTGIDEPLGARVQSPTYALCNVYEARRPIHHFDLYRIEDEDDLETTGYWDIEREGWILVEWAERLRSVEESCDLMVALDVRDEDSERRAIELSACTDRAVEWLGRLKKSLEARR